MIYQLKIQLKDIDNPVVWRRILVPAQYTFFDLHEVIQAVMGWEDRHNFMFAPNGRDSYPNIKLVDEVLDDNTDKQGETLNAMNTRLSQILKSENDIYYYVYDFDDLWEHEIVIERISETTKFYPACIDGSGVCPPEDCGGVGGFKSLKEILKDKTNPQYESALELCLYEDQIEWNPEYFNKEETQNFLIELFTLRSGLHN